MMFGTKYCDLRDVKFTYAKLRKNTSEFNGKGLAAPSIFCKVELKLEAESRPE
jgi:hypothetical protein